MKALGTGLRLGREVARAGGAARARQRADARSCTAAAARSACPAGGRRMLLALTHEGDYAMAQAMLVDDDAVVGVDPTIR